MEVVVAEVDVEGAGGVDGLLDARERVDVGVGFRDVERNEQGAYVVLAGEPMHFALDALRLEVELEGPVQRHVRIGVRPVQVDAVHADAARSDGHGVRDDLLRRDAEDVRLDQREGEGLERWQVELQGRVLLLEVRSARELD